MIYDGNRHNVWSKEGLVRLIAVAIEAKESYVSERLSELVNDVYMAGDDDEVWAALIHHMPNAEVNRAYTLITGRHHA